MVGLSQVAEDATSVSVGSSFSTVTVSSFDATGGTTDERLLIASVAWKDSNGNGVSSVTFDGTAMTKAVGLDSDGTNNFGVDIYYTLAPASTTGDVVATFDSEVTTSDDAARLYVTLLDGAAQNDPTVTDTDAGTSTSTDLNITVANDDSAVIAAVAVDQDTSNHNRSAGYSPLDVTGDTGDLVFHTYWDPDAPDGTETPDFTWSTSAPYRAVAVLFKNKANETEDGDPAVPNPRQIPTVNNVQTTFGQTLSDYNADYGVDGQRMLVVLVSEEAAENGGSSGHTVTFDGTSMNNLGNDKGYEAHAETVNLIFQTSIHYLANPDRTIGDIVASSDDGTAQSWGVTACLVDGVKETTPSEFATTAGTGAMTLLLTGSTIHEIATDNAIAFTTFAVNSDGSGYDHASGTWIDMHGPVQRGSMDFAHSYHINEGNNLAVTASVTMDTSEHRVAVAHLFAAEDVPLDAGAAFPISIFIT